MSSLKQAGKIHNNIRFAEERPSKKAKLDIQPLKNSGIPDGPVPPKDGTKPKPPPKEPPADTKYSHDELVVDSTHTVKKYRYTDNDQRLLFLTTRSQEQEENYDALWQLNMPILSQVRGWYVALETIEFPNTVYPINQYNWRITWDEYDDSATITNTLSITLAAGNYTGPALATALTAAMDAESLASGQNLSYSVTYDSVTSKKMTFTYDSGAGSYDANDTIVFKTAARDMYDELGLDDSSFAAAHSIEGDYPVNVSGTAYIDVISNFSHQNYSNTTTSNILVRIPLHVSFGNIVFYEPEHENRLFMSHQRMDEIRIQLRDDKGNFFELPGNGYVSLTLKATPVNE
jgi:hypothetical protein